MRTSHTDQNGFTLLELLIVIIVVGILAAIAIPVYASQREKAKAASLKQSRHLVVIDATTCQTTATLSTTYSANAGSPASTTYGTAAGRYLSNALEATLENGVEDSNGDGIVNPYSKKRTVLNQTSATLTASNANPAVLITNSSGLRYASFQTQSTSVRNNLRGAVVVCWNTLSSVNAVQVYSVDKNGTKSAAVDQISLAP